MKAPHPVDECRLLTFKVSAACIHPLDGGPSSRSGPLQVVRHDKLDGDFCAYRTKANGDHAGPHHSATSLQRQTTRPPTAKLQSALTPEEGAHFQEP